MGKTKTELLLLQQKLQQNVTNHKKRMIETEKAAAATGSMVAQLQQENVELTMTNKQLETELGEIQQESMENN